MCLSREQGSEGQCVRREYVPNQVSRQGPHELESAGIRRRPTGCEREAIQSQRLVSGWNLVSAALATTLDLRGAFGDDAAVYVATGASSYAPLDLDTPLPFGKALWVHAPTARVATWRGLPRPLAAGTTSTGPLHAWPRLEGLQPALHLEGDPALMVFDAATRRWLRRDPSLPAFLSDAPSELGAAQTFWAQEAVRLPRIWHWPATRCCSLKPEAKQRTRIIRSPPFMASQPKIPTCNGTILSGITRTTIVKTRTRNGTKKEKASGTREPARWAAAPHTMP